MKRAVVAGMDEAGLGPLLGPLCLGYANFSMPAGGPTLRRAMREACAGAGGTLTKGTDRVRVCDSKLLYRGARRFEELERTALAFLWACPATRGIQTIGDVLSMAPGSPGALAAHPWYRELNAPVPLRAARADVLAARDRIVNVCKRNELAIEDLAVRVVPEGELNALFEKTKNKSVALFEAGAALLARAARGGGTPPLVVCDRQGGRAAYAPFLSKAFGGAWVRIVKEGPHESLYQIQADGGAVRVVFAEKGERRSFACALASCLAKYSRELAMNRWNAYFQRIAPGVRSTAGYFTDAMRYMNEARAAIGEAGVDVQELLRTR